MAKAPSRVRVRWAGEHRFDAGRPDGPTARFDASGKTGPSPVDGLVGALSACTMVDVVDILAKRRTPIAALTVDATGERADAVPARLVRVRLDYDITGEGIDRGNAERAIDLAISKYCSVRSSLDPAIPVEFSLTLNGEAGDVVEAGSLVTQ
jgi:putative redox protein